MKSSPPTSGQVPIARHGQLPRSRPSLRLLQLVAIAVPVLLISVSSVAAFALAQIRTNVATVALPEQAGAAIPPPPSVGAFEGDFSMLIVGSDECVDTGGCRDRTEKLNDFTMLLHVAEDHQSAVAVTIPRDLIVPIPSCPHEDGTGNYNAMSAQQINVSLTYGGLACTVLTVRALTGMQIPYAGVMTFAGVREISTAIGGVPICIDAPINDRYSGLKLDTAGEHLLQGDQALQFLRTRHGVGDGSDTGRIGSQQAFLSSMLRTIKTKGTLTDPTGLYTLADAASRNMQLSDNIANPLTLTSVALMFKDIPLENITFVKYPAGSRTDAPGRVFPNTSAATELFDRITNNQPVIPGRTTPVIGTIDPVPSTTPTSPAASTNPSPSPTSPPTEAIPGATGQTATQQVCSKANN